ncbi:MAG: tyrosine-type recombinase/integrase, partial [Planctomycetes bacterium]|nr:tyrosine-type recombinase/integrase [Planctomycetota bacterium]
MNLFRPLRRGSGKRARAATYYVRATIGGIRRRASTGCTDRRAAEERARQMVERWEREAVGLATPADDAALKPIGTHVAAFLAVLSPTVTRGHAAAVEHSLGAFLAASGVRTLNQITAEGAAAWLAGMEAEKASARTLNRHLQAVRQFVRWALRTRRLAFDPLAPLALRNVAADRRHVRRALTSDEAGSLLAAARARPLRKAREIGKVTEARRAKLEALGDARAVLYALAMGTGLRRGELQRLRWADLALAPDRAAVTVRADSAKSRREQVVPLRADLAEQLVAFRPEGAAPLASVFPSACFPTRRTFLADLEEAGIERHDDSERVVDFHSLRVTFVSGLARAGVHPRVAQALARHSRIDLTMGVYTDLTLLDTRGAVEALPQVRPN